MTYSTIAVTGNIVVSARKLTGTVRVGGSGGGPVYPVYEGETTVTPTQSLQTLETNGYLLESDITVNPIPSNYIDTTDATGSSGSQILYPYTFYSNGVKLQGTIQTKTAATYIPSTQNQIITAGQYLGGNQTIEGVVVSGLTSNVLKKDVVVKVGSVSDDDSVISVTGTVENATATVRGTTLYLTDGFPVSV